MTENKTLICKAYRNYLDDISDSTCVSFNLYSCVSTKELCSKFADLFCNSFIERFGEEVMVYPLVYKTIVYNKDNNSFDINFKGFLRRRDIESYLIDIMEEMSFNLYSEDEVKHQDLIDYICYHIDKIEEHDSRYIINSSDYIVFD